VVSRQPRRRAVIMRALIGGLLVLLELPVLLPLIVAAAVTWTIRGVYILTRGLRSDGHGHD
jgi:hypothetical protein